MNKLTYKIRSGLVRENDLKNVVYDGVMLRRHSNNQHVECIRLDTLYAPGRDTERLTCVWRGLPIDIRRADIALVRKSGRVPLPR